ncbi:hypothetical protein [Desulfobacter latus]|uniref:Uncharacterized protein n=1 Tax=Desulfobacter latus TaxID=2292 RepID=A0A850T570_9BACT|nr:hypothetical protein [Desulfobacter latus]NWH03438.1 hypothetical protein [Desulfobacter latus]
MNGLILCVKTEPIFTRVVLVLLALIFLTGCGQGLSDATKTQAKAVKQNLKVTRDFIESQKKKYDHLSASPEFSAMAEYASKEKWDTAFANAGATLARARQVYDKGLDVTLKQDNPEGEAQALVQIKQVNAVIREAKNQATAPFKRVRRIKAAMTGVQAMQNSALAAADTILSTVQGLEQGPVAKAKEKFPGSEDKITARFAPFSKMADETKTNADIVKAQYTAHTAGNADYAAFVTAADAIEQAKKTLAKEGSMFEKDIDQLYRSYTKILEDMKVESLGSTQFKYFHKYLKEENGETSETGWEVVNASFYEQNLENLGMAILSKPYGEFEPDFQAAPPGMAYVGNPEYGEWKQDESGNRFWSWYGKYAFFSHLFFFPPHYYSYGSWNRWNRDYRYKKPYYGQTQTGRTFGSRGTRMKQSPRYQNSTFSKTGGFKTASASVRGRASGLRGGGPKSRGK